MTMRSFKVELWRQEGEQIIAEPTEVVLYADAEARVRVLEEALRLAKKMLDIFVDNDSWDEELERINEALEAPCAKLEKGRQP